MIDYDNSNQFKIILQMSGSVLPGCLPVGFFTFSLGLALALYRHFDDTMNEKVGESPPHVGQFIVHSFSIQTIAVVIGYLLVVRTNMALGRWMDGISEIQLMISKWGDAYDALSGFFAGRSTTCTPEMRTRILNFRVRTAHWFSLMSCLAFATLRRSGEKEDPVPPEEWLDSVPIKEMFGGGPTMKAKSFSKSRSKSLLGDTAFQEAEKKAQEEKLIEGLDLLVLATPTAEEVRLLSMAHDKVSTICLWIIQSIILEIRAGTLDTPPPIVSRVFQEISNGMLGFNQAHKVAMTPFPFPFAQMVSLLLVMLYIAMPFYIDMFTKNPVVTPIISFLLPSCYCGLNRIAIELEEPFGTDANDVNIEVRHEEFLMMLVDVLRHPDCSPVTADFHVEEKILRGLVRGVDPDILADEVKPYIEEDDEVEVTLEEYDGPSIGLKSNCSDRSNTSEHNDVASEARTKQAGSSL